MGGQRVVVCRVEVAKVRRLNLGLVEGGKCGGVFGTPRKYGVHLGSQ